MTLFADNPVAPGRRPSGAERAGRIALLVAVAIGLILALAPAPYVIEKPGPVFNTLGTAPHEGEEAPLITIEGADVYPTEGSLDLLTVSLLGNPEDRPNWLNVAVAWFDPSEAVVPLESAFPSDVTSEQREAQNQLAMVNSQQDAIAAALTNLGYDYPSRINVMSLPSGSPAQGVVEEGDQVVSVNGVDVADVAALRAELKRNGTDTEATLEVLRDGSEKSLKVTPVESSGNIVVGINVKMEYDFPFKVGIQLDRVGGPSAGMMFALGIIDKLTPGAIQGGENVAGTGTIDQAGHVGPIGGIRQKLYGARDAGAEWFLAPQANCDEITGHIPDGLTVFAVQTLDDSLAALDSIRTGSDTGSLAACPAS
ncbi:MAG: ATP-dependent serine peptidase containing a domain protein [Cryobacterium sp.]|nr:ATP-dependent serine peptidase containing a domain protein [Cryobacterium sp.]